MVGPIDITKEALVAFNDKLRARGTPGSHIRLGVKGGGCSGFSYVIAYEDDVVAAAPADGKHVTWSEDGVNFIMDRKSIALLSGTVLVFKRTMMSEGFSFENPQEASKCGCGTSFTIK